MSEFRLPPPVYNRRWFLRGLGSAGVVAVIAGARSAAWSEAAPPPGMARWSDPATWGGSVPGEGDVARVSKPILLDENARVAGVIIEPAGILVFDPCSNLSLACRGNLVVQGRLEVHPDSAAAVHEIVFEGVDESRFQGGGMAPLEGDVGLWVDGGVVDLAGAPKTAWTRATGAIGAGATSIVVQDATGWRPGDEVVITPTGPAAKVGGLWGHEQFDRRTISSISGTTLMLDAGCSFAHPAVSYGGQTFTAEVLNLTRNVRVGGTDAGRSHFFVHSGAVQSIKHVEIHHTGPRDARFAQSPAAGATGFVPGRYGLHFHHCMDASRGSVVEGVVVRDSGSHAFVPHSSHGIVMRDCISHATHEDAYWWDPDNTHTNDLVLERCVASMVLAGETAGANEQGLTGMLMFRGTGNVAHGCVAVGVQGGSNSSGFQWPSIGDTNDVSIWDFADCLAHNNGGHGFRVWQNTSAVHLVDRSIAYHNLGYGIHHGAYSNPYHYRDLGLYGNGDGGIYVKAMSQMDKPLVFERIHIDQAGLTAHAIEIGDHKSDLPPRETFTRIQGCQLQNTTGPNVRFVNPKSGGAHRVELVDNVYSGTAFWVEDQIDVASIIRVQDATHGAVALHRKDQAGTPNPSWNAAVTDIPPFA